MNQVQWLSCGTSRNGNTQLSDYPDSCVLRFSLVLKEQLSEKPHIVMVYCIVSCIFPQLRIHKVLFSQIDLNLVVNRNAKAMLPSLKKNSSNACGPEALCFFRKPVSWIIISDKELISACHNEWGSPVVNFPSHNLFMQLLFSCFPHGFV